jgi:hypothetical protein
LQKRDAVITSESIMFPFINPVSRRDQPLWGFSVLAWGFNPRTGAALKIFRICALPAAAGRPSGFAIRVT